jgi:RNA polymerase sigma-70 factor (ECF subfamily)
MQRLAEIEITAGELEAARAGDREARRALFERVAPPTLGIIRRLVAQRALAEDLLQDTLIAMFGHLGEFRGEAPFGIWVRSIAVSRCLMAFRSPWHRARVALESWTEDSHALGESAGRTSDLIDLDRALAKLSPVTRAVVWLYDVEGWSHEEIARAFGRSVSFSKSQLARGHARLRTELQAPVSAALVIPLRSALKNDCDGQ